MPSGLLTRYRERQSLLQELANSLQSETQDATSTLPHIDRVVFRVKTPSSFEAKALDPRTTPPYSDPLTEIEDQVAGRIIVFFSSDIAAVEAALRGSFNTVEKAHRRPRRDEEFGYESFHSIFTVPPHLAPTEWSEHDDMPCTFELQVRTLMMHAYAEPQHDLAYKGPADLPAEIRRELAWIAASTWGADQAYDRIRAWKEQERND